MNNEHLRQRYPELAELVDGPEFVAIALAYQAKDRELDRLRTERRIDADAEALADQTLMKGLTVGKGKLELSLIPPREIVAGWVHTARELLGEATNYVEMEIKLAGEVERFAFVLQRVGKLTPHEARQKAETERDEWRERTETAERDVARLRALFLERCGAIERVRHVCQKAKAKRDAPGMWLVAGQVLAALDATEAQSDHTPKEDQ
ncbi:hypothetical protein AB0I81_22760 [Nonomuraea sp. NPDC050404]|uniref:hypothetical protein n=1 Tax=Nonomuraea sp. NPDC050404 TaxID=3155783 RepID=UPI0033E41E6C